MKKFLGILLIALFGLLLRLIFINKAEGLWNDEYVSFMIASTPFNKGFTNIMNTQCHLPFYYLYLKFWMFVFGNSDLLLRLASVVPGVLAILAMYKIGIEHSKETGYLCAGLTAISSFLIYYSQEVRFYSLLFLFSAMSLLYTLRILKYPNKKNIILYCISNLLILITHTIGFVFVFFNLIFVSSGLFKQYKKLITGIWSAIAIGTCALLPMIANILSVKFYTQWWGSFSISKIGFLFTDYFSPVLTNLVNAPENFFYNPNIIFWMLTTTIIAISFIIRAILKNKQNAYLFLICVATIIVMIIAALLGKLVFITKYSIEIYPILIYLACFGCSTISKKPVKNILIWIYCVISLGYLIFAPYSAPKIPRAEGHKIVGDMLNLLNLQKNDFILFEYYDSNRFDKYFNFKDYNVISINKGNFQSYLSGHDFDDIYYNGKDTYKQIFTSENDKYLKKQLNEQLFSKMKPGQSVAVIMLDSVAFYDKETIKNIVNNDEMYEKVPFLFLIFSYVKNEVFYDMMDELTLVGGGQKGSWRILKFTKLNI